MKSPKGDPLGFLAGLQAADGHIRYSRSSNQTPVWVTAQALTALRKKPFPLAVTPRARRRPRKAAAASAASAGAGTAGPAAKAGKAGKAGKPKGTAKKKQPAPGPAAPTRTQRTEPAGLEPRRTAARDATGQGSGPAVSPALVAGVLAAVLALLWLGRRRLGLHRMARILR
ncbi:MAG: hypothetical protein WKF40_00345 [Thermoleophilaceae bacterium]